MKQAVISIFNCFYFSVVRLLIAGLHFNENGIRINNLTMQLKNMFLVLICSEIHLYTDINFVVLVTAGHNQSLCIFLFLMEKPLVSFEQHIMK